LIWFHISFSWFKNLFLHSHWLLQLNLHLHVGSRLPLDQYLHSKVNMDDRILSNQAIINCHLILQLFTTINKRGTRGTIPSMLWIFDSIHCFNFQHMGSESSWLTLNFFMIKRIRFCFNYLV
jgi:hypothetical protein